VFLCYLNNAIKDRDDVPLVSVFTPTYKSGNRIERPFLSLLAQTYKDFEWVIVDDSDDNDETFKMLSKLAERDYRIRVYKADRRSGRIGNVKRTACGLARGKFLVELDHDDELTPKALEWIVQAFDAHPEAGFVYTDSAECFEDGTPVNYPKGWGFGYGKYRTEYHGGVKYEVIDSPHVNPKTIRHIVAAPNHIRAWRKSFYDSIGGHRDGLAVADDYSLMVLTFLKTRMLHIPRFAYLQYRNSQGNAHQFRNQEIQRLVRHISTAYDEQIHKRFEELGVDDYVGAEKNMSFFQRMNIPNPAVEQHCTITFEPKD
jgi:glycosyltransferase involved in cell wall biosynthesis